MIRYFVVKGENANAIHRNITKVYDNMISVETVCKWHREFLDGLTDVSDKKREDKQHEININIINTCRDGL